MNLKKVFIFALLAILSQGAMAQETAIYKDARRDFKKGMHFFKQNLYGKAQEEFDKVVRHTEDFSDENIPMYMLQAELHAGLTALYLQQPDAEKRLLYFIEKQDPAPVANLARLAIGDYYYNKREYDLAIKYLNKINKSDLNNDELIGLKFKLGYCYFVKKKFSRAKGYFRQTKETKTKYYYPSNYYHGICSFFEKKYDKALASFEKAKKSKRYGKVIPTYLCQIYFAQKDYDNVIKYGEPIVDDNTIRERQMVEQILGQSYFEKGNYQKALPRLENYIRKTPKVSKEAMYQFAYTQYKTGHYKDAIGNFEQLNNVNSQLGQNALYNMADCLLKTNKKTAARQAFQKASNLKFDTDLQEDALINYAKLSYELGFDNDAINALKIIPQTSSYHNDAQNLMSKVFLNTRDYDKALTTIRQINPREKKLRETWQKLAYFKGLQYFNAKNYLESTKLFNESLEHPINDETKALAYFWRAESKFNAEKYDASIKDYFNFETIALKLKPSGKNKTALPANSSLAVGYYGLGYNYIKKGDRSSYNSAAKYFEACVKYIEPKLSTYNDKYVSNFVYPDALLRAGDCYIYLRNYDKANKHYNTIIRKNYPNKDYAMYQKSLIYGLKYNAKPDPNLLLSQIALLDKLVEDYPNSLYADDALYTKGNTLLNADRKKLAIEAYEHLLKSYPQSEKNNQALLKLGLISYSLGRNEEALNYYKAVFRADPQSEAAQDALGAIKEIYITDGNPDGYFNFMNTVQGFAVKDFERDSLMYVTAQIKLNNGDLEGAVSSFSTYLQRFPSGMNHVKARFNRGEALFDLKRYKEALRDYQYISAQGSPTYAETANYRAATITYYNEDARNFAEAEKYYDRLEKIATTQELLFEAQQLGLRASYYADDFVVIPAKADKLMANPRATPSDHAEANYFKGKAYLKKNNTTEALIAFNKNIELSGDDDRAAESRYWRAYITYTNRDLDKAMDRCFEMNKEVPNHTYWIVKAFILLSDIYAEKNNLFQAKATLQSILDNYNGDKKLIDEAKRKLKNVIDAENGKSKIRSDNTNEMDMIED